MPIRFASANRAARLVAVCILLLAAAPERLTAAESRVAGRTLAEYEQMLQQKGPAVRRRLAAKSLRPFGSAARAVCQRLLTDEDPSVRYWAASHLGDMGGDAQPAKAALQKRLKQDSSRSVKLAIAYALARCGEVEEGLRELEGGLMADERGRACSAAEFLGRIGPAAKPALPTLRAAFQRHSNRRQGGDYHVRGAAQNAIRKITQDRQVRIHKRPTRGGAYRTWLDRKPSAEGPPPRKTVGGRPNILWISCEDISPNLGCYGDRYASTPNLDRLAREGARFTRAFTPAGVCAVVRSGLITGVYPVSLGSQHMRSRIVPAPEVRCFTEYLRAAGYFCTNKSKTDYQFNPPLTAWDRQGNRHNDWRDRAAGQPFFSVINLTVSHESQIRHSEQVHQQILERLKPEQRHDPVRAAEFLPPIYPQTKEALKDWAWYSDNISEMDRQVGQILARLEQDGLSDNTVVVFWSDHGRGLPRGKRWIYESGVHVPVIVRWPRTVAAGSVREDLVTTQDLAPTMLAVAGVTPPDYMQGRVILGKRRQPEPPHLFFHRDRMDEAYDLMRAVRDRRYKYIRNFEPEKPYAQHIDYMDKMPTLVDLRRLDAAGKLKGATQLFMAKEKPVEELYDIEQDPHETINLAERPEHQARLKKLRAALEAWQIRIGDRGLTPEPVLMEQMRPGGRRQQTAPPVVQVSKPRAGRVEVRLSCPTPGASLALAVGDTRHWKLYHQPVSLPLGAQIRAKACRLGFADSRLVKQTLPRQ